MGIITLLHPLLALAPPVWELLCHARHRAVVATTAVGGGEEEEGEGEEGVLPVLQRGGASGGRFLAPSALAPINLVLLEYILLLSF